MRCAGGGRLFRRQLVRAHHLQYGPVADGPLHREHLYRLALLRLVGLPGAGGGGLAVVGV
ncbi:hypothetical protein [Cohnella rhizosphaerae]|uniref:Uncharacterized protein n=1 Tax=Cohnella rhizosphaerae TaxID=1457232 RepID=A0A9X4KX78_9BACL|nr:hypothetical protein [Cohnella rhizosphaerae]MDG0812959.1 hypothetical protein [Cohnella rhizosphaerae]